MSHTLGSSNEKPCFGPAVQLHDISPLPVADEHEKLHDAVLPVQSTSHPVAVPLLSHVMPSLLLPPELEDEQPHVTRLETARSETMRRRAMRAFKLTDQPRRNTVIHGRASPGVWNEQWPMRIGMTTVAKCDSPNRVIGLCSEMVID